MFYDGNIVYSVTESGAKQFSGIYNAWGEVMDSCGSSTNPIGYAGEYHDEESGMIYLRGRYYDPELRRFITEDPAKDGWNWYAYCGNNPVMFVDPTGLDYVPLRDVAEAAGGDIEWNAFTKTAVVKIGNDTFRFSSQMMYDVDGKGKTYIDETDNKMYVWVDSDINVFASRMDVPSRQTGYTPPKKGPVWDKEKKGWRDKDGNVWVRDKSNHGGKHWDVQYPNGGYDNVYENGHVRRGKGGRGMFSPVEITVDARDVITFTAIVVGAVVIYEGIKWGVAAVTALPSGGVSLGLASMLP